MWIPDQYKITDKSKISEFVASVGLGTLILAGREFPVATHTPMELEVEANGDEFLRGHISNANPQSKLFHAEPKALAIFLSPANHYISSSWYEKINAPTWNYLSVHMYGRLRILNKEQTYNSIKRLTDKHERISKCPVALDEMPEPIKKSLNAVTGFEIKIEKTEAAFKLSQNRNKKDMENIISELKKINTAPSFLTAENMETYNTNKDE